MDVKKDGKKYNSAAIPQPLAQEVALYVHSKFHIDKIRFTKKIEITDELKEEFDQLVSN